MPSNKQEVRKYMDDDPIRRATLDAFKQMIMVCVFTDNKDHNLASIGNG